MALDNDISARRAARERESERICASHVTATLLWTNVSFDAGYCREPSFKFDLEPELDDEMAPYAPPLEGGIDARLGALSTMLAHSQRLSAFPALKKHFWATILESREIQGRHEENCFETLNWHWLIDNHDFPVFKLELSRRSVTSERLDALYRFFTTPPAHALDPCFVVNETVDPDAVRVVLRFPNVVPAPPMLHHLEAMLDRVFAHPARQYGIAKLELTGQANSWTQLPVIRSLLEKNQSSAYSIERIVAPQGVLGFDAAMAACTVSALLHPSDTWSIFRSLTNVSVDLSALSFGQIVALCATLRYGSRLESLGISGELKHLSASEQVQSWRWLAFAVFYPQSKALRKDNRLHALGLPFALSMTESIAAIKDVFVDPGAALVHPSTVQRDAVTPTQQSILRCTVKRGALYYTTASDTRLALRRPTTECELEALVQEPDWTCVLVPGVSLAWVKNSDVVRIERETVIRDYSQSDRYVPSSSLWSIASDVAARERFFSILPLVGPSLSSLNLGYCLGYGGAHASSTIRTLLPYCVNLEHLRIANSGLRDDEMDALVDGLERGAGDHLLSLDLDMNRFTFRGFDRLATWLANPAKRLPLRELRLVTHDMDADSLALFSEVLDENKTLARVHFLELGVHPARGRTIRRIDLNGNTLEDPEEQEQAYIHTHFHGEVLPGALALAQKLAFVSVLRRDATTETESSRFGLDSFMVASIFRFAAEPTQRRILWERYP